MSHISKSKFFQAYNVRLMMDDEGNLTEMGWVGLRMWLREIYDRMGIISFYEEDD